mgnify:CR=1 FL=1
MANPFTVYVSNDETLAQMKSTTDAAAALLEFSSRNKFMTWLLTQSPEELANALRPLRAKGFDQEASKFK